MLLKIVAEGIEAGLDDEAIMLKLVTEGDIGFRRAAKAFTVAMQNGGFRITNKDRKEQIGKILEEAAFNPQSYDDVSNMLENITKQVKDTETSQAYAIMRAWAKKAEVELPKAPKKTAGGLRNKILDWICKNHPATKQDLHNAIFELSDGKKDDPKATERYWKFVEFGKEYLAGVQIAEQNKEQASAA